MIKHWNNDQRHLYQRQNQQRGHKDCGCRGDDGVGGEHPAHPGQDGGADHCSKAHAAIQDAVPHRALVEIITGHYRQQGPDRAHEEGKDERTHKGGLQHGSIADIANTRAHRTAYPLGRQCAFEKRVALPAI